MSIFLNQNLEKYIQSMLPQQFQNIEVEYHWIEILYPMLSKKKKFT